MSVGAAACAFAFFTDPINRSGPIPACPLHAVTGLDCPFCGGTRSAHALLHGDLGTALHYHAVFIVALPLLAWLALAWLRPDRVASPVRSRRVRYALYGVVAIFTLIRNLPGPFAALHV